MPPSSRASGFCPQCARPLGPGPVEALCVACLTRRLQTAVPPADDIRPPAALPPGFEFVESLGHGGMGDVYLVFQDNLSRYVALKQLSGAWQHHPRARERFLREAQAAARLSHPGIVPILQIGADAPGVWYAMEYMEGGDVAQLLARRGGRLPWREAVALVQQVADAIRHAHAAGVVHRDLKPSNILLDAAGAPKVADFGLAWLASHEGRDLTAPGEILGTPAYLPPETLSSAGRSHDPRLGDLYSLGALLFHLVAGRPPFAGQYPREILGAIANEPAPRLSSVAADPAIPDALDDVCATCLRKSPADRYASASHLLQALHACTGPPRAWHRWRRRSWRLALCAVAVLALAAAAVQWSDARPWEMLRGLVATPAPVIAIVPLEPVGTDDATAFLASALQDELASTLTRITDLKVIATRSTRTFPLHTSDWRAARETLGADTILAGKVRKWEDRVWVSVQLIDTRDGTIPWSRTYIVRESNALNLQTDIATAIAIQLNRALRPGRQDASRGTTSRSPHAQERFARARALMTDASNSVADLATAASLLEQALQADPDFALAAAQLSLAHSQIYHWGNDRSDRRLALVLDAAHTALRLNPDLAEAEIALGHYYFRGSRDYVTARRHFDRALALSPHHAEALEALAHAERREGAFAAAARHFEAALQIDPLNAILAYNTADTFLRLRDYEKASALLHRSLSLRPGHVALVKLRGDLYVAWKGDLDPMRHDIEHRDPSQPTPDLFLMDRIDYLILAHQLDEALSALRASRLTVLEGQSIYLTRDGYEALLLQLAGQNAAARPFAARTLAALREELTRRPNDPRVLLHAGQMETIVGNFAEAQRLVRRILTPGDLAAADAFDRGIYLRSFAVMLATSGQDEPAREAIDLLLREPNQTSPAYLSLHPALRRFSPKNP